MLGIAAATPETAGGVHERDADGEPTGVVHEGAFYRICGRISQLSPTGYPEALADRAVRMAPDAPEYVRQCNGARAAARNWLTCRWSIPPIWAASINWARNYPFRSLRNAGAMLAAAPDWSVTTMNPLPIIQTGVTRVLADEPGGAPWNPDERLDFLTMLEAYTVNAAYALRFEDCTGSLEAGKDASFATPDRNPLLHQVDELTQARVVQTCFRGEVVYAEPGWAD